MDANEKEIPPGCKKQVGAAVYGKLTKQKFKYNYRLR